MSTMWDVSVIGKGRKWIDLEVVLSHPDAGNFPEDPVFALALLTSEAYAFGDNYDRIPASPLGEQIPFDDSYLCDTLRPLADQFVEKVLVYEAHNVPFEEDEAHEKVNEKVRALGFNEDSDEWDGEWEDEWRAFWESKDNLPWAKYRIWVKDENWIAHMQVNDSFDTASYSEDGPWIKENRRMVLEDE